MGDPFMGSHNPSVQTQETFIGDTWIMDENFCNETEHKFNRRDRPLAETVSTTIAAPMFIVPSIGMVDTWKCSCDVCTGNLLRYAKGVTSRTQNKGFRFLEYGESDELQDQDDLSEVILVSK